MIFHKLGENQDFNKVVDLSALPSNLQHQIIARAPFVTRLKDALYDKHFYNKTVGLWASKTHLNEVTKEMMPRSKWTLK